MNILLELTNKGYAKVTITSISRNLRHLEKNCDLNNPHETVSFIMNKNCKNSWKNILLHSYNHFLKHYEIDYPLRFLNVNTQHIRIPTTEELNSIINYARYPLSLKLRLSKETGLRPIELVGLKANDFDPKRQTIHPTTAKNGAPRILKISDELTALLNRYIIQNDRNPNQTIFGTTGKAFRESYMTSRNRTSKKLGNPRLSKIRLYDFRHYFATMLYARTKDILYVKRQLGHKRLENTLIYTQLIQFDENDNYTCKIATNVKEATQLIENGFEYVAEKDETMMFRKRK